MPTFADLVGVHFWSADSKWVAFVADKDTDVVNELYLVDMSGATPSAPIKASGTMLAAGDVSTSEVEFSPDATSLVYEADQETDTMEELYFVSLLGGTPAAPKKLSGTLSRRDGPSRRWYWDARCSPTDRRARGRYELS
jgi:Tol biopolymer transport system component